MTKPKNGFSLIELMFALAILVPVTLAIISANVYALRVSETARGVTVAMQDAHTIIERVRNTSKQGLAQVVATFPSGQVVANAATLPGEQVTVTYPNANAILWPSQLR